MGFLPVTAQTAQYGIKYLEVGQPLVDTRDVMEDNARTIEAALVRGGIAPSDVAALIASGAATDTKWQTVTAAHLTPVNAWVLGPSTYRLKAGLLFLRLHLTSPANLALTGDTTGNVGDHGVATMAPGFRTDGPSGNQETWGLMGRDGFLMGPGCTINAAGAMAIRGWYPGQQILASTQYAFHFTYPVA